MNPILILGALAALFLFSKKAKAAAPVVFPSGGGAGPAGGAVSAPTGEQLQSEILQGLRSVKEAYGADIARKVEQLFRLETANFTSGGFKRTNAPGMKAAKLTFPFGWSARGTVASDYGTPVNMVDTGEGRAANFVAFKSLPLALFYVGTFLKDYGGNVGRWNTTDPAGQAAYAAKVAAIVPTYANQLNGI